MKTRAKRVVAFEVVDIKTGEVVHTVDVRNQSGLNLEKCEMGLLRATDLDRFIVREKRR